MSSGDAYTYRVYDEAGDVRVISMRWTEDGKLCGDFVMFTKDYLEDYSDGNKYKW